MVDFAKHLKRKESSERINERFEIRAELFHRAHTGCGATANSLLTHNQEGKRKSEACPFQQCTEALDDL